MSLMRVYLKNGTTQLVHAADVSKQGTDLVFTVHEKNGTSQARIPLADVHGRVDLDANACEESWEGLATDQNTLDAG